MVKKVVQAPPPPPRYITRSVSKVLAAQNAMPNKVVVLSSSSSSDEDDDEFVMISKPATRSTKTTTATASTKKATDSIKSPKKVKSRPCPLSKKPWNLKRTNANAQSAVKSPPLDDDDDDEDDGGAVIPLPKKLRTTATPQGASLNSTTGSVSRVTFGGGSLSSLLSTKNASSLGMSAVVYQFKPTTLPFFQKPAASNPKPSTSGLASSDAAQPTAIQTSSKKKQSQVTSSTKSPEAEKKEPPKKAVSDDAAKLLTEISPVQFTTAFMESGSFSAEVLTSGEEYNHILDYIINGQAHSFGVKMEAIIKITQPSHQEDTAQYLTDPAQSFKLTLFHGTKQNIVAEIMKNGFRIPANRFQMFGQGIYFADRISKSSLYCTSLQCPPPDGTIGYIFICEVELGRIYNAKNSNHAYKSPPSIIRKNGEVIPCDSVMCTGANIPNRDRQIKIGDVIWPLGPTVKNSKFPSYTVNYNEFIVYDPRRVHIKFLAKVQITAAPYFAY